MFLINRISSPLLQNLSPFELLYNKASKHEDFKPFGCLCYVLTLKQGHHEFDPRASPCVFLGFKLGVKGYIFYDLASGEINVTRNTIFSELVFPFQAQTATPIDSPLQAQHPLPTPTNPSILVPIQPISTTPHQMGTSINTSPLSLLLAFVLGPSPPLEHTQSAPQTGPPKCIKKPPSHLQGYIVYSTSCKPSNSKHHESKYPVSNFISYSNLSSTHKGFSLALS